MRDVIEKESVNSFFFICLHDEYNVCTCKYKYNKKEKDKINK